MASTYRVCSRCVMDTSDPDILFDESGVCNHCYSYDEANRQLGSLTGASGDALARMVGEIQRTGKNKKYDCVVGVSGGVDSSYVAVMARQMGLRPLAVHLDNGWDSELAVKNIENLVARLGIDLYTHVLDWEEFKDLQVAYLKASVPDCEIPTDHAISAVLIQTAAKFGVRFILRGANLRTESHLPSAWSQGHNDWRYIRSVHASYGQRKLGTFPHLSLVDLIRASVTVRWVDILNYIHYVKSDAIHVLEKELEWRHYGGKHWESVYTKFYQGYILPVKFGYDKRRAHLSSLVCSGQMTREEALAELEHEPYPADIMAQDREYVIKKLGLTGKRFDEIMDRPKKSYWDYPSYGKLYRTPTWQACRSMYRMSQGLIRRGSAAGPSAAAGANPQTTEGG